MVIQSGSNLAIFQTTWMMYEIRTPNPNANPTAFPAISIKPTEIAINSPYTRSTIESTLLGFTAHLGQPQTVQSRAGFVVHRMIKSTRYYP